MKSCQIICFSHLPSFFNFSTEKKVEENARNTYSWPPWNSLSNGVRFVKKNFYCIFALRASYSKQNRRWANSDNTFLHGEVFFFSVLVDVIVKLTCHKSNRKEEKNIVISFKEANLEITATSFLIVAPPFIRHSADLHLHAKSCSK